MRSYPLRVRGLKLGLKLLAGIQSASYPLRVRGLKYEAVLVCWPEFCVVPLEGTWIEILLR